MYKNCPNLEWALIGDTQGLGCNSSVGESQGFGSTPSIARSGVAVSTPEGLLLTILPSPQVLARNVSRSSRTTFDFDNLKSLARIFVS
jgi:hypothetical protein